MKTTINIPKLNQLIEQGFIQKNKHPEHDLYIYNYTQLAQFEKEWNELTLACRGLILDNEYTIIARPFAKFFNLGEPDCQELPNLVFEVYDKMDGSLGILYWIDTIPFIASRGSFTSEQALKATKMLHNQYAGSISKLEKNKTYLFEIIYPENRIVLDYGNKEELVLLAVIETQTGAEFPLEDIGFPIVQRYDGIKDIMILKELEEENREGFVVKFSNNYRVKIKFEEYLRLHRIVTQVSSINIWEYLQTGHTFEEILERVPDEFFDWVKNVKNELLTQYVVIEKQCKQDFRLYETEKETALYFQSCRYPAVLFAMWRNRDYSPIIWKRLRPEYEKPFMTR